MTTTPSFTATPILGQVQIATANTNRDGTGTLGTLVTAASTGTKVVRIKAKAIATTTDGMLRFYFVVGANVYLFHEEPVKAVTPSATLAAWEMDDLVLPDCVLPSGAIIKVSTHNAETFNVHAYGGNY